MCGIAGLVDPAERMLGLGARGLSKIEAGDDAGALHDVNQGLDLVEEYHYGATGQLPVAAAMLEFALGEIRKAKSEKISLDPPGPDFVLKLEMRCQFLLDAQKAYADAIRSVDPHWAAMSGFRVGEMYKTLHTSLMMIPPNEDRWMPVPIGPKTTLAKVIRASKYESIPTVEPVPVRVMPSM